MGSTFLPSTMTIKLASSPVRNSSITTRLPAAPKRLPDSISVMASSASAKVMATITPLPAARRSEEHTSELQSRGQLVCRLLLEKKEFNKKNIETEVIREEGKDCTEKRQ